ncbi:gibberellin regulated protein [Tanacetum coccineum]
MDVPFVANNVTYNSGYYLNDGISRMVRTFGCDDKCGKRCANAGYKERCLKYCGICCGKCQGCVPSSPYADKAECPCYRDMKNSKGKSKCP